MAGGVAGGDWWGAVNDGVREWIFTFGVGQPHAGRFVRITGAWAEARGEMLKRFGQAWSMQYRSEEDAGVERWGLKEFGAP